MTEKIHVHCFPAIRSPACMFYRLYSPFRALSDDVKPDEFDATLSQDLPDLKNFQFTQHMKDAQIFLFQRFSHPYYLPLVDHVLAQGKKVVYEVDDDFFHLPAQNPHYKVYKKLGVQDAIKAYVSKAHAVTVTTEPLRELYSQYNDNVVVVPNAVDYRIIGPRAMNNKKVVVGYQGAVEHKSEFKILKKALDTFTSKSFRDKVHVKIFGAGHIEHKGCETIRYFPLEYFHEALRLADFDIGLAPLAKNKFNEGKSNLKWLEYGALGTVTIASDVYPYSETILDDPQDGFIVEHPNDWIEHVELLIEEPDVLEEVRINVENRVKKEFDVNEVCLKWYKVFSNLLEEKNGTQKGKETAKA